MKTGVPACSPRHESCQETDDSANTLADTRPFPIRLLVIVLPVVIVLVAFAFRSEYAGFLVARLAKEVLEALVGL